MGPLIAAMAALAAQATGTTGSAPPATGSSGAAEGSRSGQYSYVDFEGGGGYSTNPLMSLDSSDGRGFGRLAVHAVHTRASALSTTVLSGYAENLFYTNGDGSEQSLSFDARHDSRLSEKFSIFADAHASYDKGGQLDTRLRTVPDVPPLVGTPQPPELLPTTGDFLSVTGRRYGFSGHVGGSLSTSPRDSLTFTTGVDRESFRGQTEDNHYTTIPASIWYQRQISPQTSLGAQLSFASTNYSGPTSFRTITPQLTAALAFSQRLSLNGAVGVTFASVDDGISREHTTGLAANASLCDRAEHGSFCGRVGVNEETATTAGPTRTFSAGLDYSRRLDANSTIQFAIGADHYNRPVSVISGQTFSKSTYYRAAASYTRGFGDRLFGGVDLSARKLTETGPDPKGDLSASLFIRYRLGDLQ
jgi:hypothetical protein